MKNIGFICFAIACVFGLAVFQQTMQRAEKQTALSAGQALACEIQKGDFSRIVHVGPSTRERLNEISANVKSARVEYGDAPFVGDGTADFCIYLSYGKDDFIGLRIRRDARDNRFHIAGYWTP